jgi:hypothetical protein
MANTTNTFDYQIATAGYYISPGVVPAPLLTKLRKDIPKRQQVCERQRADNGLTDSLGGAAHHLVGGDDSLSDFLECMYMHAEITQYFGGNYILNSYGALNNERNAMGYKHGHNFHRDVRTYSHGFKLMLNMLVMVDDFTQDNGATKLIPGSQLTEAPPPPEKIAALSIRALGTAGSILLFDSNVWHSAAPNITDKPRMALTLTFTRPFFKQQVDYPRMLGEEYPRNEAMRQLLGYNARVPASLSEWYQPPASRMYKPGQG